MPKGKGGKKPKVDPLEALGSDAIPILAATEILEPVVETGSSEVGGDLPACLM